MNEVQEIKGKIKKIIKETKDVVSVLISTEKKLNYKPGQFVMISFPKLNEKIQKAFSIASSPTENEIRLTIKLHETGTLTKYLFNETKIDDEINIKGPYGHFIYKDEYKNIVLIAAGSGIAPMRGILKYVENKTNVKSYLFFTTRTKEDIIYNDYLNKLKNNSQFKIHISLTKPNQNYTGPTGRINLNRILELAPPSEDKVYFICGRKEMVLELKKGLKENGANQVITEAW